jgi:hypothetical protein
VNPVSTKDQLNKRWQKLCEDIAAEARRQGAVEPLIFASEAGLCVIDSAGLEHPKAKSMNDAILFVLRPPPKSLIMYDSGGW